MRLQRSERGMLRRGLRFNGALRFARGTNHHISPASLLRS